MSKSAEKTVTVAALKAQLSAILRAACRGHSVVVCDRDTPVARLVPYASEAEPLTSRMPTRPWGAMELPGSLGRPLDSLAALREERHSPR